MTESKPTSRGLGAKFMRLWQASGASNLADGIWLAAGPLMATTLTRDPLLIAGLVTAQRLPWFLFSVPSGVLVDRFDRKQILWIGNTIRAVLILAMGVSSYLGVLNIYGMYLFFFLLGAVEPFFDNASFAILPRVVEQNQLERANGQLFATTTVANDFMGPPIGSFLFALFPPLSFLLSGLAYGGSAGLMASMPGSYASRRGPEAATRFLNEIRDGFKWFWGNRILRALAGLVTLQNLVATAGQSLLVLYAQDLLGLDAVGYGLLISIGAFGGMLGGIAAEFFAKRYGAGRIIIFETLLTGFAFITLGVTHILPIVVLMLAINSFSFIIGSTLILSLRQTLIPDDLLGRVTAVYRFIVIGAAPLGSLLGGVLARRYGLPTPYWVGGIVILLATLITYPFINNEAVRIARREVSK